jgi:Ca-activated chloride channel homolog
MKKLAALSLAASLVATAALPSLAQTRARRVPVDQSRTTASAPAPAATPRPAPTLKNSGSGGPSQPPAPQVAAGPEEVGEDDIIKVNTTLVTLPVSVRDRQGRFMPSLAKEDFRVFEDGAEQQVAYFATVEKPFTVALVIDTSGSTRFRIDEIQDAAIAFVNELRADDRVIVVSFDDDVRVLSEATTDRRRLRDAIRSTRHGNGTRLYDAVDLVINQKLARVEGRKAVVLFTDGVDTSSRRASYDSNLRDAEELDALVYPVQYDTFDDSRAGAGGGWPGGGGNWPGGGSRRRGGGSVVDILGDILGGGVTIGRGRRGGGGGTTTNCSGCTREEYERGDRYLGELARLTGARRYRADSTRDLSGSFSLIAEELRRSYSLGYYPSRTPQPGERRRIRVRVMQPDLVVQTRDTYVFGEPNGGTQTTARQTDGQQRPRPTIQRQPLDTMK